MTSGNGATSWCLKHSIKTTSDDCSQSNYRRHVTWVPPIECIQSLVPPKQRRPTCPVHNMYAWIVSQSTQVNGVCNWGKIKEGCSVYLCALDSRHTTHMGLLSLWQYNFSSSRCRSHFPSDLMAFEGAAGLTVFKQSNSLSLSTKFFTR